MTSSSERTALWALIAGFTLWSFVFVALYALQALGCAYDLPHHRLILIAAYVGSLVAVGLVTLWTERRERVGTLMHAAVWGNRAALASTALVFLPVLFVSACTP